MSDLTVETLYLVDFDSILKLCVLWKDVEKQKNKSDSAHELFTGETEITHAGITCYNRHRHCNKPFQRLPEHRHVRDHGSICA